MSALTYILIALGIAAALTLIACAGVGALVIWWATQPMVENDWD